MNISVIGAGLIGKRRAETARNCGDNPISVFDTDQERAEELATAVGAKAAASIDEAIEDADIVVISTPNKFLLSSARTAVNAGKHVLIEKPMGRNIAEAEEFEKLQDEHKDLIIKVGFNHRYHPAIAEAKKQLSEQRIGDLRYLRAVYGHGGRPGYEKEWRGSKDLAGGGELTDQGVHLIDLTCWLMNSPNWVFAQRRQYFWPLNDGLEDNGFITLGWDDGKLAQLHTSWTQWKNRFSFHLYGTAGALEIDGLGGSYGTETLTITTRKSEGGVPDIESITFPEEDLSWEKEWEDLKNAIETGSAPMGNISDGMKVMQTLNAVYKSCDSTSQIPVSEA